MARTDHPSFGNDDDDRERTHLGKQFVANGTPLEHPFKRIRNTIAEGLTDSIMSDMDASLAERNHELTDASDRLEMREMMDEATRAIVEKALHPNPSISIPARITIGRNLRKHWDLRHRD